MNEAELMVCAICGKPIGSGEPTAKGETEGSGEVHMRCSWDKLLRELMDAAKARRND